MKIHCDVCDDLFDPDEEGGWYDSTTIACDHCLMVQAKELEELEREEEDL